MTPQPIPQPLPSEPSLREMYEMVLKTVQLCPYCHSCAETAKQALAYGAEVSPDGT